MTLWQIVFFVWISGLLCTFLYICILKFLANEVMDGEFWLAEDIEDLVIIIGACILSWIGAILITIILIVDD